MCRQYLTFTLDNSLYAVSVFNVQEVLAFSVPIKLPCSISYVDGIINSRDHGIAVINLRKKFAMESIPAAKNTRIMVMEVKKENGEKVIFGAVADSVQEVIELEDSMIEQSPKFGSNIASHFIKGLGKRDGKFIIILNMNQIFSTEEIISLESAADSSVSKPA